MIRTHQIKLKPSHKQKVYFRKACGVARFVWNWGLECWQKAYQSGAKTSEYELKKQFNALKKQQFPWVYEVTKYASQQPFIHLGKAFKAFFRKEAHYPKYKKKGERDSFYIGGDQIQVENKKIKIPLLGWVKLRESLRFQGHIHSATITHRAGRWFVSIHVETQDKPQVCKNQAKVGVDLGIKHLATLSTGETIEGVKPLKKQLKKLKRKQRSLSRRTIGSKNREKLKKQIANIHYKITCQRQDNLHKLTTNLTTQYNHIAIENLHISKMLQKKHLARQISDMGFFEFKRQLKYKAEQRENHILEADPWFPSSKKCSSCGQIKEHLSLAERTYHCPHCDIALDRDLNAALCLEQLLNTVSSTEIDACGQDGSAKVARTLSQPAWSKQELSPV